jgi:hypothetical protein
MPARSEASFTDAFIKSLKPAAMRYDVYDKNLAGFGVRVSKTRVTLGRYPQMPLAAARQRAMNALLEMADGEFKRSTNLQLLRTCAGRLVQEGSASKQELHAGQECHGTACQAQPERL